MKNRTNIVPWPALPDHRNALSGTSHTISADRGGEGADSVGLCETWRAWEAGTSSEFLNWFLFSPHGTPLAADVPVLEDWVCFQDDSSELDDRARALLGNRMALFRANPAMRIVIGGLAGRPDAIAHSMRLGLRRVRSIRAFLLVHGIDSDRIGIAVRGPGWSVAERSDGMEDPKSRGGECRLQVTDPHWTLAKN